MAKLQIHLHLEWDEKSFSSSFSHFKSPFCQSVFFWKDFNGRKKIQGFFYKNFRVELEADQATGSSYLQDFFVVLAWDLPVLDGFEQHFQATVHFSPTSAID